VHETIRKYCSSNGITAETANDTLLAGLLSEHADAVTYRNTKEEVERLFVSVGRLMYRLLRADGAERTNEYGLLQRVFSEQYELSSGPGGGKKQQVKAREKSQISAKSVQSPHDTDCEYRDKGGHKVKGYSVNIVETCDADSLNLIVGVRTEGSGTADVEYLEEGLKKAQAVVTDKIAEAYTDGAYHSGANQEYCSQEKIEWVLRGIQGKPSKYDLSFDETGSLSVVNTESGERLEVRRSKSRDPQAPERWVIKDGKNQPIYFDRKDVVTCALRKRLREIPKERHNIRNNVEATIFQVGYHYRNDKSRYRGLLKHRMWAISRCIWVNFRRIQLWSIRKADRENDEAGFPQESFVLNFLQRFLFRFFWPPVLAARF
jgi:hypothetical protein